MLLRSASTPLLNSLVHASNSKESPIESESVHQIQRLRSLTLSSSPSFCYSPISAQSSDESTRKMKRTASESDLRYLTSTKKASKFLTGSLMEDVEEGIGFGLMRISSYDGDLGLSWGLEEETEVSGGGGMIHGGGKGKSGGRSDDGVDEDGGQDSNGNDSTDVHYRKMIEANPGNVIFLSNYAKFLKEVRKDYVKAEKYCERAILVNGNDGNVLAMYAELVWKIHKDSSRAETYFNQAVAASPDDCYVQASYARFLWDAEEEEEEEEVEAEASQMKFITGPYPITAMS
ncbi:unnamed protein product [Cochlearia groenlandica]